MGEIDLSPLWISVKTAGAAILVTFFLGLYAARFMNRCKDGAFKAVINTVFTLTMVLPPTVVGFFLLCIFGVNQPIGKGLEKLGMTVVFTWQATVIAAVVISFPLMYWSAKGAMEQVDKELIAAGRTLGMSERSIFWKVIFPNALPGIISGGILSYARGLGEFGATAMLAGNIAGKTRTLPLAVYSDVAAGNMNHAGIYVSIIVIICFSVVLIMNLLQMKEKNKKKA